jgi:hypothetical protein
MKTSHWREYSIICIVTTAYRRQYPSQDKSDAVDNHVSSRIIRSTDDAKKLREPLQEQHDRSP